MTSSSPGILRLASFWPYIQGGSWLSMGWAPWQTLTGLIFEVIGCIIAYCFLFSFCTCLLDNGPSRVTNFWILVVSIPGLTATLCTSLSNYSGIQSTENTTTRSQVRALCVLKLLVISIAFYITSWSQPCTVRGEGYVITMDDVRAVPAFSHLETWHTAKQHGLVSRKIFGSDQTNKIRAV